MEEIKVGSVVSRNSYGNDIDFIVSEIKDGIAILKGVNIRLIADAPLEDLKLEEDRIDKEVEEEFFQIFKTDYEINKDSEYFIIPGKVLHFDGDIKYLKRCLAFYEKLNVPCYGIAIREMDIKNYVGYYLNLIKPNILVITGHDSYNKKSEDIRSLESYKNSRYFVEGILEARKYRSNYHDLIIIAGACQSNYEALMNAGANFASSPERVNIHSLDPAYIATTISYTRYNQEINLRKIINETKYKEQGIGGIETRGTLYRGYPNTV